MATGSMSPIANSKRAETLVSCSREGPHDRRGMPLGATAPLYDPQFEHDGCGVGFVANIAANRTHEIVEHSIEAVRRVAHRGAFDADAKTGDGSGLMLQVPSTLFRQEYEHLTRCGLRPAPSVSGCCSCRLVARRHTRSSRILVEEVFLKRGMTRFVWRTYRRTTVSWVTRGSPPSQRSNSSWWSSRRKHCRSRQIESSTQHAGRSSPEPLKQWTSGCMSFPSPADDRLQGSPYGDVAGRLLSRFAQPGVQVSLWDVPTSAIAPTPFRTGIWRSPFECWRTTASSTPSRATRTGPVPVKGAWASDVWGDDIDYIRPVIPDGASDSANLDNVLELLTLSGRSAPHAMVMLIREAWKAHSVFNEDVRGVLRVPRLSQRAVGRTGGGGLQRWRCCGRLFSTGTACVRHVTRSPATASSSWDPRWAC